MPSMIAHLLQCPLLSRNIAETMLLCPFAIKKISIKQIRKCWKWTTITEICRIHRLLLKKRISKINWMIKINKFHAKDNTSLYFTNDSILLLKKNNNLWVLGMLSMVMYLPLLQHLLFSRIVEKTVLHYTLFMRKTQQWNQ